ARRIAARVRARAGAPRPPLLARGRRPPPFGPRVEPLGRRGGPAVHASARRAGHPHRLLPRPPERRAGGGREHGERRPSWPPPRAEPGELGPLGRRAARARGPPPRGGD